MCTLRPVSSFSLDRAIVRSRTPEQRARVSKIVVSACRKNYCIRSLCSPVAVVVAFHPIRRSGAENASIAFAGVINYGRRSPKKKRARFLENS